MAALTGDFFQVWWPMGLDFGLPVGGFVDVAALTGDFFQVWWPMGLDFGLPVGGFVDVAPVSIECPKPQKAKMEGNKCPKGQNERK